MFLSPRTRLGILSKVECVNSSQRCEVKFQQISDDLKQVTIDAKGKIGIDRIQEILNKIDVAGSEDEQAHSGHY